MRDLGIRIVDKGARCTHVAVPRIIRTPKFVASLAHAPTVLTLDYIDQCLIQNARLSPDDFLMTESQDDKTMGYNLAQSMARAKANKCRLLRGWTIYCTEGLTGGFQPYKDIVTENGGDCRVYKARASSVALISTTEGDREEDDSQSSTPEYLYLVSGTSPEEVKLWPKFRQMAQGKGRIARIVNKDWVLNLAINQEIRWSPDYEIKG